MKTYRIGLIGAGAIAGVHIEALKRAPLCELAAIVDLDAERIQQLIEKHDVDARAYSSYEQMVQTEKPDIVIVALPHYLHRSCAIWCAEQGCHVVLEKPMAMSVSECEDILAAAESNRVVVAVAHMQRFFPELVQARHIVESGELGQLLMINDKRYGNYFNEDRPRWFLDKSKSGGGIMINLGSHSIDRIQFLAGSRIATVKAQLEFHDDYEQIEATGSMLFQTESGVSAQLTVMGYPTVWTNEIELMFTRGALRIRPHSEVAISRDGQYEPVPCDPLPHTFDAQWAEIMGAIDAGKPLGIDGQYGQTVIAVIEAVYRSHQTGTAERVSHISSVRQPYIGGGRAPTGTTGMMER